MFGFGVREGFLNSVTSSEGKIDISLYLLIEDK